MDHRIEQLKNHPIQLTKPGLSTNKLSQPLTKQPSFKEILHSVNVQSSPLVISKHAQKRMIERNIHIEPGQWTKLEERLVEAKQKGLNDSLVVMDGATFIVNVRNSTVVTALSKDEARAQLFTNINGAILMD